MLQYTYSMLILNRLNPWLPNCSQRDKLNNGVCFNQSHTTVYVQMTLYTNIFIFLFLCNRWGQASTLCELNIKRRAGDRGVLGDATVALIIIYSCLCHSIALKLRLHCLGSLAFLRSVRETGVIRAQRGTERFRPPEETLCRRRRQAFDSLFKVAFLYCIYHTQYYCSYCMHFTITK